MPRISRVVIPEVPHHITQRGNRNQEIFFKPQDRLEYLKLLKEFGKKEGVEYLAYCLMNNHIHLVAIPHKGDSLAKGIGEAHRRYTRMINFRYGWRGYLFQGRFHSCPLDERHILEAARYIELNPVRAGIVEKAEDYGYSSARYHVSNKKDIIVRKNPLQASIEDWGKFLQEGVEKDRLREIRRYTRSGRPLGNEEFVKKLELMTGRDLRIRKGGRRKRISIMSQE